MITYSHGNLHLAFAWWQIVLFIVAWITWSTISKTAADLTWRACARRIRARRARKAAAS